MTAWLPFLDSDVVHVLPADARTKDVWDAWAFAAVESNLALQAWLAAPDDEKELGHCTYVASLDREEQAATMLAERVDPRAAARLRAGR